ncbi:MAG: hypothetical protein E7B59_08045 [Enterobacteriaceae bacterium]|nr:hypothetical protein [Enterobacteriaceae bacterium]
MKNNRTNSAIDQAIRIYETPAGPLFVAARHGRIKKCFTRDTAIRYLAYFMTTQAFGMSGFKQRHPEERIERNGIEMWQQGETTQKYLHAHQRCVRRLRRILKHKRDVQTWYDKWESMHNRYVKEVDELQAIKPKGLL